MATVAAAEAQTAIISDQFNGAWGTSLTAHGPDVNLPGGSWSVGGSAIDHFLLGRSEGLVDWNRSLRRHRFWYLFARRRTAVGGKGSPE